jgi:hypothetical protein
VNNIGSKRSHLVDRCLDGVIADRGSDSGSSDQENVLPCNMNIESVASIYTYLCDPFDREMIDGHVVLNRMVVFLNLCDRNLISRWFWHRRIGVDFRFKVG